jgi:hypothetical protein
MVLPKINWYEKRKLGREFSDRNLGTLINNMLNDLMRYSGAATHDIGSSKSFCINNLASIEDCDEPWSGIKARTVRELKSERPETYGALLRIIYHMRNKLNLTV